MINLRNVLFSKGSVVRALLVLSIAVANVVLFAASTSADAKVCGYNCVWREGGALGRYVDCESVESGGAMDTCREGLDGCYGYLCVTGEAEEVEIEPLELSALSK